MPGLARKEGYLLIDNRCAGEGMLERATITCCHCGMAFIKNPNRTRPRNYCSKHDAYVCDSPLCIANCTDFWGVVEDLQTKLINKGGQSWPDGTLQISK